jgi:hypothetical protein
MRIKLILMNKNVLIMALVSATLLTAAIASTLPLQHASAKIIEHRECDGPGNSCNSRGNAQESNPNIEETCTATTPNGKNEPPGQNPC